MSRRFSLWASVAFVAVLAVALASVGMVSLYLGGNGDARAAANIGGPFELVNSQGETVTEADFEGQYKLVYFGYTYCPDVCPSSLLKVSRALNGLAKQAPAKAENITPLFVTVDPARDTPRVVGDYVTNFHERMVGLSGSEAQIAKAAEQYNVRYWRVKGEDQSAYTMAHSSYVFLIGPGGNFVDRFDPGTGAERMQAELADKVSTSDEPVESANSTMLLFSQAGGFCPAI